MQGFTRVLNFAWHYFNEQGGGQIVVITSVAAARGTKNAPAYNASKAFQSSYVEGLRLKAMHMNKKIVVTELVPGYIDTEMAKGDRIFWMASVEKAAKQSRKAIRIEKKEGIHHETMVVGLSSSANDAVIYFGSCSQWFLETEKQKIN